MDNNNNFEYGRSDGLCISKLIELWEADNVNDELDEKYKMSLWQIGRCITNIEKASVTTWANSDCCKRHGS